MSARSAICVDEESFGVIYEKNADERLPMASTTKIITAITAIENADIREIVTVSQNAASTEGSSVYLKVGEQIPLLELLYALMLASGNDAAVAIAEHISGSTEKFADLMNETVKKIGAENTHCVTVNGLDAPEHYTTARDLALISRYALKNDFFKTIVGTKNHTYVRGSGEKMLLVNHNKLLASYPDTFGVKTGYTKKSGRCLVSCASREGVSSIVVTLNASDDWNDHKKLLDYSFIDFGEKSSVLETDKALGNIDISGFCHAASYAAAEPLNLRRCSESNDISYIYNLKKNLCAPLAKGDVIGSVDVLVNGYYVKSVNLLLMTDAPRDDKKYIIKTEFINLLKTLLYLVR